MKTVKQLQLLSLAVMLLAVSACQSKPKDGLTDTYTSGVIAIAADESFQPIVQEEVDTFKSRSSSQPTKVLPSEFTTSVILCIK